MVWGTSPRALSPTPDQSTVDHCRRHGVEYVEERFLVARLREGDPDAFATLVTLYVDTLTRMAFYATGSRDTADDVVQRVFVELWERRATLDPNRLRPYLLRAVRNRAIDEGNAALVRSRHRATTQAEASAGSVLAATPSPEEDILNDVTVQAAIARLSPRRRLAVRLRLQEEMSHAEIAEVLEISVVAAKRLVARGIVELRQLLWGA